jgi:hypothetical protein
MYSGKIAVPPGGGGIRKNKNLITALFTYKMTVTATQLAVHMKAAKT